MKTTPAVDYVFISNCLSSDTFVTSDFRGTIEIWNRKTWNPETVIRPVEMSAENSGFTLWAKFCQNGDSLATLGTDGVISFWNTDSFHRESSTRLSCALGRHCIDTHYAADNEMLVAESSRIIMYKQSCEKPAICYADSRVEFKCIASSSKSRAAGTSAGSVFIWRLKDSQLHILTRAHEDEVICLSVSDDGSYAASSGLDSALRLWDIEALQLICEVDLEGRIPTCLTFSRDSELIAVSSTYPDFCNEEELQRSMINVVYTRKPHEAFRKCFTERIYGLDFAKDNELLYCGAGNVLSALRVVA